MYRLAYRNFGTHESLVVNHSVVARSAVAFAGTKFRIPAELPPSPSKAPSRPTPPIAGWAASPWTSPATSRSVTASPAVPFVHRFAGRVPTDPSGTLEAETSVVTGTGSQTTGLSRWGDYSAMQVDPVDDCTFWFTTEYIKTNGSFNWNTRIANFKFPTCGGTATPDFTVAASPSSLTINQGSNGTSTITVTSLNSFSSATTLSASGLPTGVTAAFSTNPVTPPANGNATSTLTLTASSTATTGTATVTITGRLGLAHPHRDHHFDGDVVGRRRGTNAVFDATLRAPKCATVGYFLRFGSDTASWGAAR